MRRGNIYRRGSNQYKQEYKEPWKQTILYSSVCFFLVTALAGYIKLLRPLPILTPLVASVEASTSPIATTSATIPAPTPTPTADPRPAIKDYIKTIFGRKAGQVACAVAMAESGLRTTAKNVWARENSRGIFQINLKSDYAKVHYDRVPGRNLEEKIEWLEDPYNNTLLAYWIYSKSDWNPWTAYTSGAFKAKLEECK